MSNEEVIQDAKFSVVLLRLSDGVGTGFVISPSGHILTCNHVVTQPTVQVVSLQGGPWDVPVLARDLTCDLAMLHVKDLRAEPIPFADPLSVAEGQTVYALGHPLGLDFTVSRGIVSNRDRIMSGVSYVQTDASINPGNSGGPIINERGEVVGIADWGISQGKGLGFAVAVRHAMAFASRLRVAIRRTHTFTQTPDDAEKPKDARPSQEEKPPGGAGDSSASQTHGRDAHATDPQGGS